MEDNAAGGSFGSIRDRFPIKRSNTPRAGADNFRDHHSRFSRHRFSRQRFNRKGLFWLFPFRGKSVFYASILFAVFVFAMASMLLQSSITSVFSRPGSERARFLKEGLKLGSALKFMPPTRFVEGEGLDRLRLERRIGVRLPRLALILGSTRNDPASLMLYSVVKNLQKLGYKFKIYSLEDGETHSPWKEISGHISVLGHDQYGHVDWSMYEGAIVDSLEAKHVISSLMQEPFCSVPLIWIIHEDVLAKRLTYYSKMEWDHLLSVWRSTFSRADAILFSDYSLPMLYSILDNGNFVVIPGSPLDVHSAEQCQETHDKSQLRLHAGYNEDDLVVLVIGSPFFYNELSWDNSVPMHAISPLLVKYAKGNEARQSVKFVFLCGNSTDGYDEALQEVASRLGLIPGSVRHFGMDADVNGVLITVDAVLYASFQDEQSFPPLLIRAMTFGVPIVVPDTPSIKKYVLDGVHGIFFSKNDPAALVRAFSLLLSEGRLSELAHSIAASGKLLAKDMLAPECITTYSKLLENVLSFPSDAVLPRSVSQIQQLTWEWNFIRKEIDQERSEISLSDDKDIPSEKSSLVYDLEEELADHTRNASDNESGILLEDIPTEQDWEILREIEQIEESENVEMDELEERMENDPGDWNEIYRNARRADKLNFEANERDEGELERTGQPLCIYEIYEGSGAWPFLHHGSLYRGLSLTKKARRSRSDDVDAVGRLPLLNDTNHRDLLCEMGGMFSIANKVDSIHKRPWVGFQSWRAAGRKFSLSSQAEKVLEETIQAETKGEVIYFWTRLDMDGGISGAEDVLTFWSMCDILNGGGCRNAFEHAFRKMYNLPPHIEALPPMPDDGGYWSALHSWVMPTPSFLEFIMFTRMFADSLDSLHINSTQSHFCLLGTTESERRHCYCRVLELLVNVWAYHSARKMVYIDPHTGSLSEQHPVELRRGYMWAKYFNSTLLKSMDEDLAEATDDGDYPSDVWLWPLTGEVHWQGIYEKEREERYRKKMEKKKALREKIMERMRNGYKQKSLGG